MMKFLQRVLLGLACIALIQPPAFAQQQALPSLGDASSRIISPQLERRIGEAFLKQLHSQMPTSNDPLIKYYVQRQLIDLVQYSDLREAILSVVVVDDENINAFAAPGGVVGINLGLLLYAEDVHEYSSVMAHELAHLSQRHFARGIEEQRNQTIPNVAAMLAAVLIGIAGGGDAALAAMSTVQAASYANQMRFSRDRETEADRIGMNTLVRANHDPSAMSRMFERMQRAYRFTRRPPEFLLTHPLSETRIADARNQALDLPRGNYSDSLDYRLIRVRAETHFQKNPAQAIELYRKRLRDQPNDTASSYGLAISLSKNDQHEEALDRVESLLNINPQSILYNAAFAELLIAADRTNLARDLLSHQLVINPDNLPLSMLYAEALNKLELHEEAEAVLERQSKAHPIDVDVWFELAETAGLAGNITGVHLARAEYFYLHGSFHRAIQHLEYAQRLVRRTNPPLVAKLSQRIQDLRTAIRMSQS
ncbi:MAG: M48 family metalloprotease [Pseudomonadales bacterium]|nr:M48 family metalloprotease [Pseudomonadales bacterium]